MESFSVTWVKWLTSTYSWNPTNVNITLVANIERGEGNTNYHHSKAVSAALLLRVADIAKELVMAQKQWIHKEQAYELNMNGHKLLFAKGIHNIRSYI